MAKFGDLTGNQTEDILSKVDSACGGGGIKRFQDGELVVVERERLVSSSASGGNGGITYASGIDVVKFLMAWMRHFEQVYGLTVDLSKIALPPFRPGFGWGVVRLPELSAQLMLDTLKPRFGGKLWQWCQNVDDQLDPAKEARATDSGPYVVWCRDRVEADVEHKDKSAEMLTVEGVNCMTEPERIALEGWFEWATNGGHLNIDNVTLSAGSRFLDGNVPYADWHSHDGFRVGGCRTDHHNGHLRAREVVSLPAPQAAA